MWEKEGSFNPPTIKLKNELIKDTRFFVKVLIGDLISSGVLHLREEYLKRCKKLLRKIENIEGCGSVVEENFCHECGRKLNDQYQKIK